jgi:hypothetical protein
VQPAFVAPPRTIADITAILDREKPDEAKIAERKANADLRKAAERTIPRLRRRIGSFARTLTTREASNYFRHAGYA